MFGGTTGGGRPELSAPRVEGSIRLHDDRRVGFAEYGPVSGRPVLWFHGTPGGSRQIPPVARELAHRRGVRLVAIERPGVGSSSPHLHESLRASIADVTEVADRFELDRFGVIGLSGGGPYVLGCAHELPDRVIAGAVLGGVAPTRGDEAVAGGLVGVLAPLAPLVRGLRDPLGRATWLGVRMLMPVRELAFDAYMAISPPGDQRVFARPEMRAMFLDDIVRSSRRQMSAIFHDFVLFSREWGFSLRDIRVPVRFWHGDADHIVPLAHGEHLASLVPGAVLTVRPGESHLGGLDAAEEVFDTILGHWPATTPTADALAEPATATV